jgi:hypothetical protein
VEYSPRGEFRTPCAAPLDSVLDVVITNVADALVTPAATRLAVALHNAAHPQVLCLTNDGHGSRAFRRECKHIGCARFLCFSQARAPTLASEGRERPKTLPGAASVPAG